MKLEFFALAVILSSQTALAAVPMMPLPKSGTVSCDISEKAGASIQISGVMRQAKSKGSESSNPQVAITATGTTALDGEYDGWWTSSNGSFSFSRVDLEDRNLITLTFFGFSQWSSDGVLVVQVTSLGEDNGKRFFAGHCRTRLTS